MMSTHNFDHHLYQLNANIEWLDPILIYKYSCLVDLYLFWSTYCLQYTGYIKKVKKIWVLLYNIVKFCTPCIIPQFFCRSGIFIMYLTRMFTFMHLKCRECWLIIKLVILFLLKYAQFWLLCIFHTGISQCGHWV